MSDKQKISVDVITMGCSKNLIDSERLMAQLQGAGLVARHNPENIGADVAVVNTCGFIGDAKEESIEMILNLIKAKESGRVDKVMVMGCLSERYMSELMGEIPEVDGWFGKYNWHGVVKSITGIESETIVKPWERVVTTPSHSTYIKISEGCNRRCAFCAIPLITGPHHSRPASEILEEVAALAATGTKEFNIIAQDLSSYGLDLTHRQELPRLIDDMAAIEGVGWIRLHYAYPSHFPMEVLDVMAERENVCNYLDIALQHISDPVLERMRRHISSAQTIELIEEMRAKVPGLHLRTTLMVGFPGETDEDFHRLLDFVNTVKFERMGAFAYCEEENTWAAKKYSDDVPTEVKQERLDILMAAQQEISEELQAKKVGSSLKVLIDGKENGNYVGRTQWDSPEVDPEVIVTTKKPLRIGEFYDVEITDSSPFELYGKVR